MERAKHTIFNTEKFQQDRAKLGEFITKGMKTTGGTDIDWVIEHRGGFIVMENKSFHNNIISITVGQMITFEQMYKKLNADGRCHFLVFGFDEIDFKDSDSIIWYFDMKDWSSKKICPDRTVSFRRYHVNRSQMIPITLKGYRNLMEKYWKEFER